MSIESGTRIEQEDLGEDPIVLDMVGKIQEHLRKNSEERRSVDEILMDGRIAVITEQWKQARSAGNASEIERLGRQLNQLGEERRAARTLREQRGARFENNFGK